MNPGARVRQWLDIQSWGLYQRTLVPAIFIILTAGTTRCVLLAQEESTEARLRTETTLHSIGRALSPLLAEHAITGDFAAISTLLQHEASDYPELRSLTWHYGKASIQTTTPPEAVPQPQGISATPWFANLVDIHSMQYSMPIELAGHTYGDLTITSNPLPALEKTWRRLHSQIITVFFIIGVMSLLLAFQLHGPLSRLRSLAENFRRFHLDHNERASESGSVEVRTLAHAFNLMADEIASLVGHLRQSQQALRNEKIRAEITLLSIGDGVIATDASGLITLINPVAEKLTGWAAQDAVGRPLEQVFQILNLDTRIPLNSPVNQILASGKVKDLSSRTLLLSRDGMEFPIEDSAAPIREPDGQITGCVLVFHDVTERHKLLDRVSWQASHDALTGLPNRTLLSDRINQAVAHAERNHALLAVCFLDLDHFKPINDRYGHAVGDRLLIDASKRMSDELRGADTLARLGGDEFVLLLTDLRTPDEIPQVLNRVLKRVAEPYLLDDLQLEVTASIGVAVYPSDKVEPDLLMRHADNAMYQAKQNGRNRFHVFDADSDQETLTRFEKLKHIREGLQRNEFVLYYQPKINMRTGKIIGLEALIRWQHPQRGMLPPSEFMPLAEQSELIVEIGQWVLNEAMNQIEHWLDAGCGWPVSINQAARDFMHPQFVTGLKQCLARHPRVPPSWIELEILETASIEDLQRVSEIIHECHTLGVTFALDDFGTGYSSLSYLKGLPADCLKIDQTFVRDMLDDKEDMALVEGVISLAKVFQRSVIAEGVESPEHGVLLLRLGCDNAQGYGIARPMPADAVPGWVDEFRPHASWALWADTQWELQDFPLLVAQFDHQRWVRQVLATLEGKPLQLSQEELSDHHQCRFGHWYYHDGKERYGHLPVFTALEFVHAMVHRVGREIVRLHRAGDNRAAHEASQHLIALREQIIQMLAELQHEVASLHLPTAPLQSAYAGKH